MQNSLYHSHNSFSPNPTLFQGVNQVCKSLKVTLAYINIIVVYIAELSASYLPLNAKLKH